MTQCRYCGRPCGCRDSDPCVCGEVCYDCDVKPDELSDDEPYYYDDDDYYDDADEGGES